MKTYFINLDKAVDRRRWMERQLSQLNLPFERISAVDGSALPKNELDAHQRLGTDGRPLTVGEIAVGLSHRTCWQRFLGETGDYACFMEDDAHLSGDMPSFLSTADWIPDDADVVKLETFNRYVLYDTARATHHCGRAIVPLAYRHYGSAGYILSRECARRLLDLTGDFRDQIDICLFDPDIGVAPGLKVYQIVPALCVQNDLLPGGQGTPELASQIERERKPMRETGEGGAPSRRRSGGFFERLQKSARKRYHKWFTTKVYDRIPFRP